MKAFDYNQPTVVSFGAGRIYEVGQILKKYGARKVLLLYGGKSIFINGSHDKICKLLQEEKIEYVEYGGCQQNPSNVWVDKGANVYINEGCDFILSVGGGSIIDAGKAISMLINNWNPEGIWYYFVKSRKEGYEFENPGAPLGVVLTVAATGSETNRYFVISNYETAEKFSATSFMCRPLFALCDPELTFTLDAWQTASGATDIISHVLEQYLNTDDNTDVTDNLSLGVIKSVIKWTPIALKNPNNLDARSNLMWASTLALNDLLGAGVTGNWMTHQLGHVLTAVYGVNHGSSLSCMTPYYMDFIKEQDKAGKIAKLGNEIFGLPYDQNIVRNTIVEMRNLFESFGMPVKISDFNNINAKIEDLDLLARKAIFDKPLSLGGFDPISVEDAKTIFKNAFMGTLG